MEDFAIAAGLVLGVACWWWLVRCMRINGRPWWWRHLAGLLLANFAMAGLSMLLASLLGVADENGEPLGGVGAFGGLVVALPMLIQLAVSWRAARRTPAQELPARAEPEPEPEPAPRPEPTQAVEHKAASGEWRDIEGETVDFDYLPEGGGGPVSHSVVIFTLCESHFAGLSLAEDAGTDDQVFAFDRVVGRTYFPAAGTEVAAEDLQAALIAGVIEGGPASANQERDRLRFVYEDAKGNVSTRELTDWHDDGAYIEGYCHTAEDVRTFRRDRIVSVLEGEHLLRPLAPKLDQGGKGGGAMEILFTGFPADERSTLEEDAESYGLVVRKTVTKNLDFVCAGPRAGSSKLAKARAQGCTILDEDDFWSLVEDGVMPE